MDKLEKALFDAGWNKEMIECFLKIDPIEPSPISLTKIDFDTNIDILATVDGPQISDSSSLVFMVTK